MTREEAIELIRRYECNSEHYIACEMAIKALEQEPCEDAISRDDAIRIAEQGQIQGFEWEIRKLVTLPSVNPQPKTGHWILHSTTEHGLREDSYYTCSSCRSDYYTEHNYCPKCGADMKGEK